MKLKKGDTVKILNTEGTSQTLGGISYMDGMIGKKYKIDKVRHKENKIIDGRFPYVIGGWGWLEENVKLVRKTK